MLATEGVVSIPLVGHENAALAVTSHFYEFVEKEGQRPKLAHELETGREYSVLLTTGGGLWRYRLGDRVQVTGFVMQTPLLEFLGREDDVCDLCGEKLNAAFVGKALAEICSGTFSMLAPSGHAPRRYILFVEGNEVSTGNLDERLRKNPHYDYCRRIGQLAEPLIFLIRRGGHATYLRRCELLGQRVGNVKPMPLNRMSGWEEYFEGNFAHEEVMA